ncbi:SDR family NAD(P)-dependent oxidoreductase [Pseudochelatococcus sp. B33]
MALLLTDKVAVVVGGSGGIGAASARRLAQNGAKIVVGYHSGSARAEEVVASLAGEGHMTAQISLADSESIRHFATEVEARYGRTDILINSGGMTKPVPHRELDLLDDSMFDRIMVANVRGVFATVRCFAPILRRSGDGVIVNISSVAALRGTGSSIAYAASKGALDTMSMSLARVLAPEVRVLTVSPSGVDTGFVEGRSRCDLDMQAERTLLKRVIEPDDVAKTVLAAIAYMPLSTGSILVVDGGSLL